MAYSRIRFEIQNSATMTLVHIQSKLAQANEELFITRVRSQQIRHKIAAPLLRLQIVV